MFNILPITVQSVTATRSNTSRTHNADVFRLKILSIYYLIFNLIISQGFTLTEYLCKLLGSQIYGIF